jgi:hypothetical protein
MRQIKSFCFLITLIVLVWNCGKHNRNAANIQTDSILIKDSESQWKKISLPPLEAGEIHLTDDAFGPIINLKGVPLNLKEIIQPEQLLLKDKYLIVNNQRRRDSIFMIFELPDLKCIAAFGERGRGPDELSLFTRIIETAEDSILCYVYEMGYEKIYKVSMNKLRLEYYLTLPKGNRPFEDKQIIFLDYKTAYYSASTEKGKMIYYFNKDSLPQERQIKDLAISGIRGSWTTYIGDLGINKNFGRIAYAYKSFKRLRIIDLLTMDERDIIFDTNDKFKKQDDIATLAPTNITHFWGMSPNEKYFWMLYSGRTPIDVQRDNRNKNKYIFVEQFDWNGNPVKKYRLDDWGFFCVDEKNKIIYLASTASIYSILKYNIPDSVNFAN